METTPKPRTRRPRSRPEPASERAPASTRSKPAAGRSREKLHADLVSIALCLMGVLLALALYRKGSAGMVGTFLVSFTRLWIGQVVVVAPLLCIGAGLMLALDHRRATNLQMLLGTSGLLIMGFGWLHLLNTQHGAVFDTTGARFGALLGKHPAADLLQRPDGGLFGAVIMSATFPLGHMGAFVTLAAVGVASVLLISELTIRGVAERIHERSRIAAEHAKRTAAAARERAAETRLRALEERTQRDEEREIEQAARREQKLFLELDRAVGADAPAPREEKRLVRRAGELLRGKKPASSPAQPALPEPDDMEPEELDVPLVPKAKAADRRAKPEATRDLPAEEPEVDEVLSIVKRPVKKVMKGVTRGFESNGEYQLPPFDLLVPAVPRPKRANNEADANIAILENTLAQFRIQAQVVEIADGPSVTRYEIRLGEGIRVKKILDLADNLAMSLSAMSVRVEAPIPGKAAIGIEVPKKLASVVTLRECLESSEFSDFKSPVSFVLGKDVAGNVRCADLARMPHLLVAGATNSGKSVCLNVLIASMLFRCSPDQLKMIMIDPKRVELTLFDGIPHLIHPVVKDVKQAAGILRWVLKEMDRRYDLFAKVMTRNIDNYNEKMSKTPQDRLPFLVVVIDELADLMMQQGPEIEQAICRLAQLARATGIHLVIATQRPSVDVITGLIKANVPSRIAFSVSSQIDSRTILDAKGAENLIGRGDMLFKPIDATKPIRIQGAFLREEEVERMVIHLKAQGRPEYVAEAISVDHGAYGLASEEEADDEMFEPAARFVVTTGHASTSMIQRRFKIGYTRAARLVDMMEARGIVGPLDGAKPRDIRMSRLEIDEMFLGVRDSLFRGDLQPEPEEEEEVEIEETVTRAPVDPFVDD